MELTSRDEWFVVSAKLSLEVDRTHVRMSHVPGVLVWVSSPMMCTSSKVWCLCRVCFNV